MRILAGLLIGLVAGAIVAGLLVALVSGNRHDKSLEIVMTAVFAGAPIGGLIGLIVGIVAHLRRRG